jgi:glucosamine-6-phosphate deaminase
MDEWLDWQGWPVSVDHPLSFRGYCHKYLYDLINPELRPPEDQIIFPSVYDIDAFSKCLREVGGPDTTFAGFGYRGHLAFNEPPSTRWHKITADEMAVSKTRIVPLLDDTIVALSQRMTGGYTQAIPRMAITVGMADIIASRKIHLLTDGGAWKQYILRVFLLSTERDVDLPVTLLHGHPNVEVTVDAASAAPIQLGLEP